MLYAMQAVIIGKPEWKSLEFMSTINIENLYSPRKKSGNEEVKKLSIVSRKIFVIKSYYVNDCITFFNMSDAFKKNN